MSLSLNVFKTLTEMNNTHYIKSQRSTHIDFTVCYSLFNSQTHVVMGNKSKKRGH